MSDHHVIPDPANTYVVDLQGLTDRERKAVVDAIEQLIAPLRRPLGQSSLNSELQADMPTYEELLAATVES